MALKTQSESLISTQSRRPSSAMFAADRRRIDKAEAVSLFLVAGPDIGRDPRAFEAIKGFAESRHNLCPPCRDW